MEIIKQGDTYEYMTSFTQKDVDAFAAISGDRNPIHLDAEYASKSIFGRRIVHGFLAGSVFSKVFGTFWPGEGTIYLFQELSFRAPVFVDTEYVARFIVEEVYPQKHRGLISSNLETLDGKQVIVGKAFLQHEDKL